MDKLWYTKNGDSVKEYKSYLDALKAFREEVRNYFYSNIDAFCNDVLPFSFGVFFSARYDAYEITDEDIVIQERVDMLLSSFRWENIDDGEKCASRSIPRSYHYYARNSEFKHSISVDIDKEKSSIYFDFKSSDNGDDTYLKTNAFTNEEGKNLYFIAKEIVTTSSDPKKLGELVKIDLYLYSSENEKCDVLRINEKEFIFSIIEDIKNAEIEYLSISYLQKTYSLGFIRANRIFNKLIGYKLIESNSTGNKGNRIIKEMLNELTEY